MKTFELTIEERNNLCIALENIMELNSNSNTEYETVTHTYVWSTPEAEQEQNDWRALRDKLKPKKVNKHGWVLKEHLHKTILVEDEDKFQFITWEEQE